MPDEKTRKMVFRWSVFLAIVHLISLVCIYGLDVPKSIVTVPLDQKNVTPLFAITRWIDPLAWPIFAAFFLFVLSPFEKWREGTKDRIGDGCVCDVFKMGAVTFCLGSILGFLMIGLALSVAEGLICGLLNGALAALAVATFYSLVIWVIFSIILGLIKIVPVLERFRENTPSFAWCLRPFQKILNFLNAEDE